MTVHFSDVGRDKKSWDAEVQSLSDAMLIREIRKQGALMSRSIDFAWDDSGDYARILVGLFRQVGELVVQGGMRIL